MGGMVDQFVRRTAVLGLACIAVVAAVALAAAASQPSGIFIVVTKPCPQWAGSPSSPVATASPPTVREPVGGGGEIVIVPRRCDSPSRGQFDSIYSRGSWGKKLKPPADFYGNAQWPPPKSRQVSASGPGSSLGHFTATSLRGVRDAIRTYNVTSMVDVPCGDANWMFDSLETDTLPLYVGLDIASAVLEVNRQRFAHHRNKQFHFWDATNCTLPRFLSGTAGAERSFDLVHARDVVMHLALRQGVGFFCSAFRSGARVLIATTFNTAKNSNIREGQFYMNDLSKEPFSFPKPDSCVKTHPTIDKADCVYDLTTGSWVKDFISAKC